MNAATEHLQQRVMHHLSSIYKDIPLAMSIESLMAQALATMRLAQVEQSPEPFKNHWDQKDIVLISYGDSIVSAGKKPLTQLHEFLAQHSQGLINSVHILPFFPYSSDDGFAVIDYSSVNEGLGDWDDITAISNDYRLMADLVVNHCSSRSP